MDDLPPTCGGSRSPVFQRHHITGIASSGDVGVAVLIKVAGDHDAGFVGKSDEVCGRKIPRTIAKEEGHPAIEEASDDIKVSILVKIGYRNGKHAAAAGEGARGFPGAIRFGEDYRNGATAAEIGGDGVQQAIFVHISVGQSTGGLSRAARASR